MWIERSLREIKSANRTWFATLEFGPAYRARMLHHCRAEAAENGDDFDAMPDDEKFRRLASFAGRELTLAFKRLRKTSGVPFRYLATAEKHQNSNDGAEFWPHYHLLLHETDPDKCFVKNKHLKGGSYDPVTGNRFPGFWRNAGFTQWALVKDHSKAARYACKYITKEATTRVRASLHYGVSQRHDVLTNIVNRTQVEEGFGKPLRGVPSADFDVNPTTPSTTNQHRLAFGQRPADAESGRSDHDGNDRSRLSDRVSVRERWLHGDGGLSNPGDVDPGGSHAIPRQGHKGNALLAWWRRWSA